MKKKLVREGRVVSSANRIKTLREKIDENKKLIAESKETVLDEKIKAKKKVVKKSKKVVEETKTPKLRKTTKKVISESKRKEIEAIKAKKKTAKKAKKVDKHLQADKVKTIVSESIKKKLEGKLGKKVTAKKDPSLIKEEDEDEFDEMLGGEEEIEDDVSVTAELEIDTDEELELVISPDDMQTLVTTAIDELKEDDEFLNAVVNGIAGTDEPIDSINDELDTDVDMDMIDDDEFDLEDEGDILDGMLEEEGLVGKSEVIKESKLSADLDKVVLEGFEADEEKKTSKEVNIFKYKVSLAGKIGNTEYAIGQLLTEGVIDPEDEIKLFDVTVDDEDETIEISTSSKIDDVSKFVSSKTGLAVSGVKKSISKERVEIEDEIEEAEYDMEKLSASINRW